MTTVNATIPEMRAKVADWVYKRHYGQELTTAEYDEALAFASSLLARIWVREQRAVTDKDVEWLRGQIRRDRKETEYWARRDPPYALECKRSVERFERILETVATPEPGHARSATLPPITLVECDSFERVATEDQNYARHDPTGEGVEYALIQPYDLQRFCQTVRSLYQRTT